MINDKDHRLLREAGEEWGLSAAVTTLAAIDGACPTHGFHPYLVELDRTVSERAQWLLDEGIEATLAEMWERTAREAISAVLAVHDEESGDARQG